MRSDDVEDDTEEGRKEGYDIIEEAEEGMEDDRPVQDLFNLGLPSNGLNTENKSSSQSLFRCVTCKF